MVDKNIDLLNLEQLKYFQIDKNDADQMFKTFYQEHCEEIADIYFYHKKTNTYCNICPLKSEVLQGGLQYIEYFIGMNYRCSLPQIFERSHTFQISEIPLNEIEILSKEEFVSGLKKELQDALDNM